MCKKPTECPPGPRDAFRDICSARRRRWNAAAPGLGVSARASVRWDGALLTTSCLDATAACRHTACTRTNPTSTSHPHYRNPSASQLASSAAPLRSGAW